MNETVVEEKKLTRKEKRIEKIKNKLLNPVDIKYRGFLSYRYLRVIAWLALAVSTILLLNSFSIKFFGWDELGPKATRVLSFIEPLSFPMFIIASFGLVLSGNRTYKGILGIYGAAFLAVGLGMCAFYYRYVRGILIRMGVDDNIMEFVVYTFRNTISVNVFADLFAFALFHFFVNYTPTKFFQGKNIIIFRFGVLLPIAYVIGSYVLRLVIGIKMTMLPFSIYPFLTTKSPFLFFMFAVISLWIKNREKLFVRFGLTREEYREFLSTKRSALSFSLHLSFCIIIFSIIEILFIVVLYLVVYFTHDADPNTIDYLSGVMGLKQCSGLLLAIPIIMLYSYNKTEKNKSIDIAIPIAGICLNVLVVIEAIYEELIDVIG